MKAALAFVWALVGRAFCCFKRRRKLSNVGLPISVDVQSIPVTQEDDPAATWNWEEQPTAVVTVEDKIRAYRDSRTQVSESESAPEPDFFSDMTPAIRRSQKVLVAAEEQQQQTAPGGFSSRLAYTDTTLPPQGVDLTDMEEPTAWEADDINPDALENHQRALRHQQLQQKRERRAAPPVR